LSSLFTGSSNATRKKTGPLAAKITKRSELGLSLQHSSEVPLVLNLQTGSIETQYHVVFNDQFTTVSSIEREIDPPSHWEDLCLESAVRIMTYHPTTYLKDDWLTEE
jgi:hypothetical protein